MFYSCSDNLVLCFRKVGQLRKLILSGMEYIVSVLINSFSRFFFFFAVVDFELFLMAL